MLYKGIASDIETEKMKDQYLKGIGWVDAKTELFNVMNRFIEEPREKYNELMSSPVKIDKILQEGAEKARTESAPFLKEIKHKIGIYS
jgi:tryptophanyl-tRNA synthetase